MKDTIVPVELVKPVEPKTETGELEDGRDTPDPLVPSDTTDPPKGTDTPTPPTPPTPIDMLNAVTSAIKGAIKNQPLSEEIMKSCKSDYVQGVYLGVYAILQIVTRVCITVALISILGTGVAALLKNIIF